MIANVHIDSQRVLDCAPLSLPNGDVPPAPLKHEHTTYMHIGGALEALCIRRQTLWRLTFQQVTLLWLLLTPLLGCPQFLLHAFGLARY